MKRCVALLFVFVAVGAEKSLAQDGWSKYRDARVSVLIDRYQPRLDAEYAGNDIARIGFASDFPVRLTMRFRGSSRPTRVLTAGLIKMWETERGLPEIGDLFGEELLFADDDGEIWLPVQEDIATRIRSRGESTFVLYAQFVGGWRTRATSAWVFVVLHVEEGT